jgi:hypothetical protein
MIQYQMDVTVDGKVKDVQSAQFSSFEEGVKACTTYAIDHPGSLAKLVVSIRLTKDKEHRGVVFEVQIPNFSQGFRDTVKKQYGDDLPIKPMSYPSP